MQDTSHVAGSGNRNDSYPIILSFFCMSMMCFRGLNLQISPRSLCETSVDIRVLWTSCDLCSVQRPLTVYTAVGLVITSLGS